MPPNRGRQGGHDSGVHRLPGLPPEPAGNGAAPVSADGAASADTHVHEPGAFLLSGHGGAYSTQEGTPVHDVLQAKLTWKYELSPPDIVVHLSMFLVDAESKVPSGNPYYCVNHNNDRSKDGSASRRGRRPHGHGGNPDETITVELKNVDPDVERVVFVAYLQDAHPLHHAFSRLTEGKVTFSEVSIEDPQRVKVFEEHELNDDYAEEETAAILGEIIRTESGTWVYRNIGQGRPSLADVGRYYGVTFVA